MTAANTYSIRPFTEYYFRNAVSTIQMSLDPRTITNLIDTDQPYYLADGVFRQTFASNGEESEQHDCFIQFFKTESFTQSKDSAFQYTQRFLREVTMMASVPYPSIIQLLCFTTNYVSMIGEIIVQNDQLQFKKSGETSDFLPAIVTKKYSSDSNMKSLADITANTFDIPQKFIFIYGILRGLSIIHQNGMAHCNICPATILIDESQKYENLDILPIISDFHNARTTFEGLNHKLYYYPNVPEQYKITITDPQSIEDYQRHDRKCLRILIDDFLSNDQPKNQYDKTLITIINNYILSVDENKTIESICSDLDKNKNEFQDALGEYKEAFEAYLKDLNDHESKYYVNLQMAKMPDNIKNLILPNEDIYDAIHQEKTEQIRTVRKLFGLTCSDIKDKYACYFIGLFYYRGYILPKNLVMAILYLKYTYFKNNPTLISAAMLYESIKDRANGKYLLPSTLKYISGTTLLPNKDQLPTAITEEIKQKINNDKDAIAEMLYYRGALHEAEYIYSEEIASEHIKAAIKLYIESLNYKLTPVVAGKVYALLSSDTKYQKNKMINNLRDYAIKNNDQYAIFSYACQCMTFHTLGNNRDVAIQYFTKLLAMNYIDAAYYLAKLYSYDKKDAEKAKRMAELSEKIYGKEVKFESQ